MEDFSPIARLEAIILKANSMDGTAATKKVWGKVFNYNTQDRLSVADYAFEYLRLVERVEVYLSVVVKNYATSEINKSSMISLKELVFTFTSSSQWNAHNSKINDSVLVLLEMGKALYHANYPESEAKIENEYIEELRESLDALFQSVFNSDLSRELRLKLSADIVQMMNSLKFYEVRGSDGLQESMSMLVGRYAFNSAELKKDEAEDVRNKFNNVFSKFFAAMSHANTLHQFLDNAPDIMKQLVEKL
ncbi:hypothetical protein SAMN04487958_114102 [Vreelandella subterranea]|uniref:Uncharacterized protein n=1 Tax=Vreelandella subterranea TaxID=416874 RepID=A0A1H9WGJ4_9GAMM|nr:hypothetical protein [Halomonas subterranea]SES32879.1 hypothetical protein SAMN04487958_114102 [Halomonas subterranea]